MQGNRGLWLLILFWLPLILLRPPTRQQELRVLITARNMVEEGNWLHFEFQNRPRYRKPPLPYWLAAAGYSLTGRTDRAWAARLPFLLVTIGGAVCLSSLAKPRGLETLWLLALSAGYLWYGSLAETDMPQLAGMTAALWGWRRGSGITAGAGMAFAVMSKGPGGALIPLITMMVMAMFGERRRAGFWISAIGIPLATAGGWLAFLQLDPVAREALRHELTATFVDTEHRNPLIYYVYTLPLLMLPGIAILFRKTKVSSAPLLPKVWFGVTFVLLTLTISKQQHYALMLIPPAAWWLASRVPRPLPRILQFRILAPTLLALSLGLGFAHARFEEDGQHSRFLRTIAEGIPPKGTLHVVGINSARFDFHLGRHVDNLDSAKAALKRAQPGEAVVIIQKREGWDAGDWDTDPVTERDDEKWVRRFYLMP